MSRSFEHRFTVTIGDTNMEQNVYWANYCKWFGEVRELFLMSLLPPSFNIREFLESLRLAIITCDISMRFLRPAFFADPVVASLNTDRWGRCSLELIVQFSNERTGEILATGLQKVAFVNADTQKFVPFPRELRDVGKTYDLDLADRPVGVG